jgi:tetratricopeptide (TPR) repeat protein
VNRRFDEVVPLLKPVVEGSWNGPAPTPDQRLRLLDTLGLAYTNLGRLADAKPVFDELLALHRSSHNRDTRAYAIALVNSSGPDTRLGHFDEADTKLTEAIAVYDALGPSAAQYRASAYTVLGLLREAQGRFDVALEIRDRSSSEWAQLRKQALEQYPYTHRARGLVAAAARRDAEAVSELQQFFDLAQAQGRDISGDLAQSLAVLAGGECAIAKVDQGQTSLVAARAAAKTSYDAATIARLLAEAELRCALAGSDDDALASALAALTRLDETLLPGEAGEFARHTLLRVQALRRLSRDKDAGSLAAEAIARLAAVHLEQHPFVAQLNEAMRALATGL